MASTIMAASPCVFGRARDSVLYRIPSLPDASSAKAWLVGVFRCDAPQACPISSAGGSNLVTRRITGKHARHSRARDRLWVAGKHTPHSCAAAFDRVALSSPAQHAAGEIGDLVESCLFQDV